MQKPNGNKLNKIKKKRRILINKEFSLSFIFSIFSALLGFAFSFLAARFLGADRYGELQFYLSLASILSIFMVFGSDNYVIKHIQFSTNKKSEITRIYTFMMLASIFTLPFYFIIAYFFLTKLNQDIILILIIFLISLLSSACSLFFAFLTGISKNQIRTLLSGVIPHLAFIVIFIIHLLTNSLNIFMSNYLFYYLGVYLLIVLPFLLSHIRKTKFHLSKSEFMTMFFFAMTWITYNAIAPLTNILVGQKYEEFGIVGIFSISNQLLSIAALANGIIINISYPIFSKLSKEGNKEKLFFYYQTVTRINIYITIPFYIAFMCEPQNLYSFFGESYQGYNWILILLSFSSIIECATGPWGSVLLMGGKEKENLLCSIIKFMVYMIIFVRLIDHTVYAAPIGLVFGTLTANIAKLYFVRQFQGKNFFGSSIYLPLICVSAICGLAFFGLSFISNQIIWAIANCIIGLALIISFVIFSPFKKDKYFFTKDKNALIEGETNV